MGVDADVGGWRCTTGTMLVTRVSGSAAEAETTPTSPRTQMTALKVTPPTMSQPAGLSWGQRPLVVADPYPQPTE